MTQVLLVMDFQNDIVNMHVAGGSKAALERASAAIQAFRTKGAPLIFVKVAYRDGYPDASDRNKRVAMLKSRGLLQESSEGAQLSASLAVEPHDPVVIKRRVSAFAHTDLHPLLSSYGADTLVMAGLSTS